MDTVQQIPANKNPLSKINFRFGFKRTPNTNYTLQRVFLPGISMGSVDQPTPRRKLPLIGNASLMYDNFSMEFIVDEELQNYLEIVNWIKDNAAPDSDDQALRSVENGIYSDGVLTVSNSAHQPRAEFLLKDMFPISISQLEFNTTDSDKLPVVATAQFRFMGYSARKIVTQLEE